LDCSLLTIYAPNSFTPDNDGTNDLWYPVIQNLKAYTCYIFNRWGEKIFTTSGAPWDGTYAGNECPMGVYTFVLDWTDNETKTHRITGHITLIR
jgi:gliding motility-associated-like protein